MLPPLPPLLLLLLLLLLCVACTLRHQLAAFEESLARHAFVPSTVVDVIAAMPNGSHPMACLMAGLTALGACYPSQNPAIAGVRGFAASIECMTAASRCAWFCS
jgi:citrate synthase